MQLYEKYRPKRLADVIGQGKAVKVLHRFLARDDWDRDALWIEGPSGTGKSSIALALAEELQADRHNVYEIDGDKLDKATRDDLEDRLQYSAWGNGVRVIIVNEAHAVPRQAVQWLLTALERIPARTYWIFTTTEEIREDLFGEFGRPLASRCKLLRLTSQGLAPKFAARAREIAQAEGMDGQPDAKYLRLVQDCKNNMRLVLQRIEMGEMLGE